jgi:glyoxylase-like metal-dependent hydrolase (beta-lactamase superfamily II)
MNSDLLRRDHPVAEPAPARIPHTASIPAEVAPGVRRLRLPWTCAYILSDGTNFSLVDTGTQRDRPLVMEALAALKLDPANCQSVLLTHGHCDHAGNAAYFAEEHGATYYAHGDEQQFLETSRTYGPRDVRGLGMQGWIFAVGEVLYPVWRRRLDVLLHEGDVVATPVGAWRVLHTPGHTPGHVCYFRESDGVLISGDALLTIVPFLRIEALAVPTFYFNSDTRQARRSTRRLGELATSILLPGHGRPLRENTAQSIQQFVASLKV